MSLLLFLPLLIYELLYNGPAFVRLGEPFSWLTHLNGGTAERCFSVAHHRGGVGNLRVSDFFPVCGSRQHIKCRILVKTGVFCFCGEIECVEKKMKVRSLRVTFAQFAGRKGVTKISRTLVREGICRRSESLFL